MGLVAARLSPVVLCVTLGLSLACNRAPSIRAGMSEAEVRNILGNPSSTHSDKREFDRFFFERERKKCLSTASKVWFFQRFFLEDVAISFDNVGNVICVLEAHNDYQE